MIKKISVLFGVFLITLCSTNLFAQSPAEYLCDKYDGKLSDLIEDRSFVGDTYRCDVKKQWDMMIQSELNRMLIEDDHFGNDVKWKETFVDTENYYRKSFSFNTDKYNVVNFYVPFEKKTDHFFIAQ